MTEPATPSTPPANWYPDPDDPTQQRYWDGTAWTDQRAPAASTPPKVKKNGWAVAALVLGIISIVVASIPTEQWVLRVLVAALGLAFGIVGIVASRSRGRLGMSVWGIVLSGVALIIAIVSAAIISSGASAGNGLGTTTGDTFDKSKLQSQLVQELKKQNIDASKVLCPADRPVKAGTSFDCGYTLGDGTTGIIHVKVQDDKGTISWETK